MDIPYPSIFAFNQSFKYNKIQIHNYLGGHLSAMWGKTPICGLLWENLLLRQQNYKKF